MLKLSAKDISDQEDVRRRGNNKGREKLLRNKWLIFEAVHVTKSGKKIPVEISSRIFNMEGRDMIMSLAREITKRKQVEKELAKHREHLEELVKERTTELEEKNSELKRFNDLFVNREFRIKELKERVMELEKKQAVPK